MFLLLRRLKAVKCTPSKRARPCSVASQRYPSFVWAMEWTDDSGNPALVFHAVWIYCVIALRGSSAIPGTLARAIRAAIRGRQFVAESQTVTYPLSAGLRQNSSWVRAEIRGSARLVVLFAGYCDR